jgi:GNAT superfamily N-acetyltransferase
MEISIREARLEDLDDIVRFNAAMALETEGKHLSEQAVRSGCQKALADPERSRYFLAETEGRVVGQIMFTLEWSDWRDAWFWWIQSVYVDPAFRGRGVFSQLYRYLVSLARARADVCGLRLYVENDNRHAQQVYDSLGMHRTGYVVMETMFNSGESHDA